MAEKIKIGISRCLLGENVRYDGGHKLDHYLKDTLGMHVDWVGVCPEVEYGLPVPRETMRLVGDPASPRLMTIGTNIDHTAGMKHWTYKRLKELEKENLCGFIFKSRSPSSGIRGVKVYGETGVVLKNSPGIFGGAFLKHFPLLPAEDDDRLQTLKFRENFIERVFVYRRWLDFIAYDRSLRGLIAFHADHKLLLMAHSNEHYRKLGKLVAEGKMYKRNDLLNEYIVQMTDGLRLFTTVKKNTNVLMHIMGYFKNVLSGKDKKELIETINNYHKEIIPLIEPITLLQHYVNKYDEPYLKKQYYLNPHPAVLMLRNHA
ncbi:MAG: DUF523 and DUF1722 domain-containing protein [Nitrospirae bacterium]|nr:DUF523 and DUF1722 domain-containing protein [Nitrospirota bacterium]